MGLHPTGAEALANAEGGGLNLLARGVHALAIAMLPLLLVGFFGVTQRLQRHSGLAASALAAWGLALVAVMTAAIMSGVVAPSLAERVAASSDVAREEWLRLLRLIGGVAGAGAAVATLGGWLALDVRGFGAVVLAQGVWMLGMAWWLVREAREGA